MTEGWKIALFVLGFTIFLTVIGLFWPQIFAKLWGKHPDTIIYVGGYEYSYYISELHEQAPKRAKITHKPIKFPPGIDSMELKEIPITLRKWTYPKDSKLFYIQVSNYGESKDEDILIEVNFPMNKTRIIKTEIENNDANLKIVEGGNKNSSRIIFKIDELLPNTRQCIEILTKGKELSEIKAWSGKKEKAIGKIFIFDIEIKPDKDYVGPSPFDMK